MVNNYWIESVFGKEYACRIIQIYRMGSRYSIGSVYGMEHGYRIVKVFRIFIRKKSDGR